MSELKKVKKSRQSDRVKKPRMVSIADEVSTKTREEAIEEIYSKLQQKPEEMAPAYTLILGAGFSQPAVPRTQQLVQEEIGDSYYLDQEQSFNRHDVDEKKGLSASFWEEFNAIARSSGKPPVELDEDGLPGNITTAYQRLFTYVEMNKLFASAPIASRSKFISQRIKARPVPKSDSKPRAAGGEKFVKEFLRGILDPGHVPDSGISEGRHDSYSSGRNQINGAHFFLASLLELQQTGQMWKVRPFCRTIFTTNFDTLLQEALQLVNILYCMTDKPELGLDISDLPEDESIIHLVYTHGSVFRQNAASTDEELRALMSKNTEVLKTYLEKRDIIVVGYGGWPDSLMAALAKCQSSDQSIYWCNVFETDEPIEKLSPDVVTLLKKAEGRSYVNLGSNGADGFMEELLGKLTPVNSQALIFDPITAYVKRLQRVKLGKLMPSTFAAALEHLEEAVKSRPTETGPTK